MIRLNCDGYGWHAADSLLGGNCSAECGGLASGGGTRRKAGRFAADAPREDASYFALDAGLDMAIMGLNGAYCLDRPLGRCVANHTMPEQTAWELVAVLDQYPQMIYGVFSGAAYCAELPAPGQWQAFGH